MDDFDALLARVAGRRAGDMDLSRDSLERLHVALGRLGDPQEKAPPVFHVAGTNGKGSVVAYLRAMLEAAGKSVHVYTSPHLVQYNERIVLAGEEISNDALKEAILRFDAAAGDEQYTFFETITCAAFLAFAETPADYLILEVGLGGRLDATNVVDRPLASVVTHIDLDHTNFLGSTLGLVAGEKAGIFKKGAPAIIGPQSPEAMAVLERRALEIGARVFAYGREWDSYAEHGRLIYQDASGLNDLDAPRLVGAHQFENAGVAVAAVKAAGVPLSDAAMSKGLAAARWPGRMHRLSVGPLVDQARAILGEEPEIWVDGGHNPSAGRVIARAMADLEERSSKPLVMIVGMQANKDAHGYFTPFVGLAAEVIATAASQPGVAAPQEIADAAAAAGLKARACVSVEEALRLALAACETAPRLLISGSLYLAGEVLRENA